MYKVEAVIRPERLELVAEKLLQLGFTEYVVSEVHGHESQPATTACYRGVSYSVPYSNYVRIELAVPATSLDVLLERIVAGAFTGDPGDGKIFISDLSDVIDIAAPAAAVTTPQVPPHDWTNAYHGATR
jgi:nitrogen regulatory protein PII